MIYSRKFLPLPRIHGICTADGSLGSASFFATGVDILTQLLEFKR